MNFRRLTQPEIKEQLSPDHIQHLLGAFRSFDKEKSGYIAKPDLVALLRCLGHNRPLVTIDELILSLEYDNYKKLDFSEFLNLIANLESVGAEAEQDIAARDMFNLFDKNEEGLIDAFDIKDALMWVLDKAPKEEKEDVVKYFRLSRNRKVGFEEFKDMITASH